MKKALCVLRGRPGLGHLVPALSVVGALQERGWESAFLTYGVGAAFLERSGLTNVRELDVDTDYTCWPGLNPLDGVEQVVREALHQKPNLVLAGGEYFLGAACSALDVPLVTTFNPDEFSGRDEGRLPRALVLASALSRCAALIPVKAIDWPRMRPCLHALRDRVVGNGDLFPVLEGAASTQASATSRTHEPFTVLISNGGGVGFDRSGGVGFDRETHAWLAETEHLTIESLRSALRHAPSQARVELYSCLEAERSQQLLNAARLSDSRLAVFETSLRFFQSLQTADVMIARAGAGALGNARRFGMPSVLWPLKSHGEQRRGTQKATSGAWIVHHPSELDAAVAAAIQAASARPPAARNDADAARAARDVAAALDERIAV